MPSTTDVAACWYLDENVSERLALLLILLGYDAVGTTRAGNKGISDAAQLLVALQNERVLLTHNAQDFELIHQTLKLWPDHWGLRGERRHVGILLFLDSGQLETSDAAQEIDRLAVETPDFSNLLLAWRPSGGWTPVT